MMQMKTKRDFNFFIIPPFNDGSADDRLIDVLFGFYTHASGGSIK